MLSLVSQAWNSWKNAKGVAILAVLALAIGIRSATHLYRHAHCTDQTAALSRQRSDCGSLRSCDERAGQKSRDVRRLSSHSPAHQKSFDVFGWFTVFGNFNLSHPGEPQHIDGVRVTPQLVDNLGVNLLLGRWFRDLKEENGNSHLAVLAYPLWQRLGGRKDILGQEVVLDGTGYTVVGVASAWFHFPLFSVSGENDPNEIWVPLSPEYVRSIGDSGLFLTAIEARGIVRCGGAGSEADVGCNCTENPVTMARTTAFIEPLQATISNEIRPTLLLLLGAAGLLLLITCANVSGLLVTRAVSRSRETAIRLALGAAQGQMILQYLSE